MARFLHLSDLHAVASGTLSCGVLDTRALLHLAIDQLCDRLDTLAPLDAVLATGDISDDGSPDSYAFARSELDRLGLPLLVVPGNHDARAPFRDAFADLAAMPEAGLIDWTAVVGDTQVVGLDTLVEGQGGGALRLESLALLERALVEAKGRPVVVALHHPPFRTGIAFMDAIGLDETSGLARVLEGASGTVTVLSGHVHGVHQGRIGGHAALTALSTCSGFALDRREDAPVGFFTGPTGCAVIDTGPAGLWSSLSLDPAEGPYPFHAEKDAAQAGGA